VFQTVWVGVISLAADRRRPRARWIECSAERPGCQYPYRVEMSWDRRPGRLERPGESSLSDGSQTLELHALQNSHVQGMLIAYLPKQKLLFNADLFGPPLAGPVPTANDFAIELRDGIRKLKLSVETFAGAHGRVATPEDLEQSIALRQK
jgi:glyoxylase-like metal-dependent hydrolase (beta-lactamase superfamily II)